MKKYFKILLITICLFIAIIIIINTSLFDEELNPEIVKIMQDKPLPKVKGNAYYFLMGMNAISNKNEIDTGWSLIERYQQNREQGNDSLDDSDYKELLGVENDIDQQWLDQYQHCDTHRNENCLLKLSHLLKTQPVNNSRLKLMLNRFDEILNLLQFDNYKDISYGTPTPRYILLLRLGNIKKAQLYNSANITEFLLQINKEIKFLKLILRDGDMILDKMVAQANIRNNLHYLSSYLQQNQPIEEHVAIIKSILAPLTREELDISNSYISESRTTFKEIYTIKPLDLGFYYFMHQNNAYNNLLYKYFTKPFVALSKMKSDKLYKAIKNGYIVSLNNEKEALLSYNPKNLYNFSGKADMANNFCIKCWDYAVRVHDLDNIINLVKLQFELKLLQPQNIQQAIFNSAIKNNYTNQPFDFDEKQNIIKFECLDVNYLNCMVEL